MALVGGSDQFIFTHQSLTIDEFTAFSQMEVTLSGHILFHSHKKFYTA